MVCTESLSTMPIGAPGLDPSDWPAGDKPCLSGNIALDSTDGCASSAMATRQPCSHVWIVTKHGSSRGQATVRVRCLRCGKRQRWPAEQASKARADVSESQSRRSPA